MNKDNIKGTILMGRHDQAESIVWSIPSGLHSQWLWWFAHSRKLSWDRWHPAPGSSRQRKSPLHHLHHHHTMVAHHQQCPLPTTWSPILHYNQRKKVICPPSIPFHTHHHTCKNIIELHHQQQHPAGTVHTEESNQILMIKWSPILDDNQTMKVTCPPSTWHSSPHIQIIWVDNHHNNNKQQQEPGTIDTQESNPIWITWSPILDYNQHMKVMCTIPHGRLKPNCGARSVSGFGIWADQCQGLCRWWPSSEPPRPPSPPPSPIAAVLSEPSIERAIQPTTQVRKNQKPRIISHTNALLTSARVRERPISLAIVSIDSDDAKFGDDQPACSTQAGVWVNSDGGWTESTFFHPLRMDEHRFSSILRMRVFDSGLHSH